MIWSTVEINGTKKPERNLIRHASFCRIYHMKPFPSGAGVSILMMERCKIQVLLGRPFFLGEGGGDFDTVFF